MIDRIAPRLMLTYPQIREVQAQIRSRFFSTSVFPRLMEKARDLNDLNSWAKVVIGHIRSMKNFYPGNSMRGGVYPIFKTEFWPSIDWTQINSPTDLNLLISNWRMAQTTPI